MKHLNQQIGRFLLIMTLFIWSGHSITAQQKDIYNVANTSPQYNRGLYITAGIPIGVNAAKKNKQKKEEEKL